MSVELADSYESIYQRAIRQMSSGESEEAIESLMRIINRLGRLRPETLQRKSNLQQTLSAAWNALIQFLRWEEQYDQAIDTTRDVLDRLPDPDVGRRRIASLRIEKGEVDGGLASLRKMADENPSFDAWADLGAEYRALARYQEADTCYQSALRLAGSNSEATLANIALFGLYQDAGNVDAALSAWNMAIVLNPELSDQVVQVYAWLIRRGDLDQAQKYLERDRQPVRRTFYEGLLEWQAGNEQAAQGKWRDVIKMDVEANDTDLEAWMEAALRLDEPAEADSLAFEQSANGQLLSVNAITLRGIAKLMMDDVEEAEKQFQDATDRLRRAWPSRRQISAEQWALLTSLYAERETLRRLAGYFNTGEPGT
jgi:tetratricopeptide (TPR) repeat protein